MAFTAKIKSDGRFFIGSSELPGYRDAHAIEPGKRYQGLILDSMPSQTHYVEFNKAVLGEFDSDELEEMFGDFKLWRY